MNMNEKKENGDKPFYEVKQRYCSEMDENVIMCRTLGGDGEFVCMSSPICGGKCGGEKPTAQKV